MKLQRHQKVMILIGTRPEAIKMAPLVASLRERGFEVCLGLSGQHKDLINPILKFFQLNADFDLAIHRESRFIEDPVSLILPRLRPYIESFCPDVFLVHGDTSTTLAGALAASYHGIPLGHVEAGLRSGDFENPFPEEMNRKLTDGLAKYHFAPTPRAADALKTEGISSKKIFVTGNTVIDALKGAQRKIQKDPHWQFMSQRKFAQLSRSKPWVLFTAHRRESLKEGGVLKTLEGLADLSKLRDLEIVFPMHPNPQLRQLVKPHLQKIRGLHCLPPLDYWELAWLYSRLSLVITDSGGLQEEASAFGLPILVTRKCTERQESLEAGLSDLVAYSPTKTLRSALKHLKSGASRSFFMGSPYGDGEACIRIAQILAGERHNQFEPKSILELSEGSKQRQGFFGAAASEIFPTEPL